MASGRRHDVALPSITIALAEARRLVALAPNRREKNTGIGRATAVFRHDPDVAGAPVGQAATVVVRDAGATGSPQIEWVRATVSAAAIAAGSSVSSM